MSEKDYAQEADRSQEISISWHTLSGTDVLQELETPVEEGLSTAEVKKRQEKFGPNELTEAPPTTFWEMLWSQINNFVIYMLLGAALISILLGDEIEAIAIIAIVILNAIMGLIQESRAEAALAALKKLAAPEASVLRDGRRVTAPAPQMVPGDIVFL